MNPLDDVIGITEASQLIGMNRGAFYRLLHAGRYPFPWKQANNNSIILIRSDLIKWMSLRVNGQCENGRKAAERNNAKRRARSKKAALERARNQLAKRARSELQVLIDDLLED